MKKGIAGSLQSSDCLVTVTESEELNIEVISTVGAFFQDQIETVVKETLKSLKQMNVSIKVEDRGALDQTIEARVRSAVERMMSE